MLHCKVSIVVEKRKTQMTLLKSVWNGIKQVVEIFDDAMQFREEMLRQERFKYLGR
jgi:hypothetical protein